MHTLLAATFAFTRPLVVSPRSGDRQGGELISHFDGSGKNVSMNGSRKAAFTFDRVFPLNSTQEDVYGYAARPIVEGAPMNPACQLARPREGARSLSFSLFLFFVWPIDKPFRSFARVNRSPCTLLPISHLPSRSRFRSFGAR